MAESSKKVSFVINLQDNVSGALTKVGNSFSSFTNKTSSVLDSISGKTRNLGSSLTILGATIGAAGATFGILGKKMVDSASEMEQARISFEVMLGSADEARNMLQQFSQFAEKTPFDLPQVIQGAKSLLAYNVEAEKLLPTFDMLGNIAAGVGREKLPQLILAFGQVRAATYLTGAELRQFTEAGVPLLDMLAQQSGKTAAQIKDDMASGVRVPFSDVEKALQSMTSEGGKFFNLMQKQSKTFGGVMSNTSDAIGRISREILGMTEQGDIREGSIFYYLKIGAEKFLSFLEANKNNVINFFNSLATSFIAIGTELRKYTPMIIDFLGKIFSWIQNNSELVAKIILVVGALGALSAILGPILLFISTIVGVISSLIGIIGFVISVFSSLIVVWEVLLSVIVAIITWGGTLIGIISAIPLAILALIAALVALIIYWDEFLLGMQIIGEAVVEFFVNLYNTFILGLTIIGEAIVNFFISAKNTFFEGLDAIWTFITEAFNAYLNFISTTMTMIWAALVLVWKLITGAITDAMNIIWTMLKNTWTNIKNTISSVSSVIYSTLSNIWNSIKSMLTEKMSGIVSDLTSKMNDLKNKMVNWGSEMMKNLSKGITDGIKWVADAVKKVIDKVKSKLGFSYNPNLPSEIWGAHFAQNFGQGIDDGMGAVETGLDNMTNALAGGAAAAATAPAGESTAPNIVFNFYGDITDKQELINQITSTINRDLELSRFAIG